MKPSIFNNIINIDKEKEVYAIYNSLSDRCLFLSRLTSNMELLSLPPKTLSKLIECGMVIDSAKDEVKEVSSIYKKMVESDQSFILIVNPTLNCNFRCWYCYENHEGKMDMTKETLEHTKQCIKKILAKYEHLELSFFGGEPLLRFESVVKPLMTYTKEYANSRSKKYTISFTTNGYLISHEMITYFKKFNMGSFQITLDGDRNTHNKTRYSKNNDSFDTIINNIQNLANSGLKVILRINATHENIDKAKEIVEYLNDLETEAKKNIWISIHQVWQDKTDILEKIWDLYDIFVKNKFRINPRPYRRLSRICYGDIKHSAVINCLTSSNASKWFSASKKICAEPAIT